ncbi:D-alanyl-D-alanine carboxypeptidase family protein [Alteribacter populi]|uniref:D-alanyl-D-alanine carboxypeptidase family protein n=1 Tax=Alteribacter populi TaxID=2011011 RepID=UPI000BBAE849|nr:D-alanyl-D-alanine carboxypeptidase family protein [Alteribacter populi]
MKKQAVISLIIIFLLLTLQGEGYRVKAVDFTQGTSAKGAVLIEQESGRVLYEKEAHTPMRIASITKIMTAILAIEAGSLEEKVTVSSRAEGTEGSSLYLKAGEKLPLKDLVYGLMLRSGNDAAVAIAEQVGGSLEGFIYLMNEKAREIGMNNTIFNNPHGLDDHEDHYSSAYDMALLMRYAMENETFREISSTKTYRASERENGYRVFNNKNRLLTQLYKYSTGGKTGYTKRAKRTLVSTAAKDDVELIAVTLNAGSDWHDHMNLFNWAFAHFNKVQLVTEGKIQEVNDPYYEDKLYASHNFVYPLSEEEVGQVEQKLLLLTPPGDDRWLEKGHPDSVGAIHLHLNDEKIGVVPLTFETEVEQKRSFLQKVWDIFFIIHGVKTSG